MVKTREQYQRDDNGKIQGPCHRRRDGDNKGICLDKNRTGPPRTIYKRVEHNRQRDPRDKNRGRFRRNQSEGKRRQMERAGQVCRRPEPD